MRRNRSSIVATVAVAFLVAGCGSAVATAAPVPVPTPAPSATAALASATPRDSVAASVAVVTQAPVVAGATLPADALKIATIGDSLTEGQGDESGRGYQGRVKTMLDAKRPGSSFVNFGHSGWTSADVINGQNGQAAELTEAVAAKPNVAFVWIGSNDLWYLYEYGPEPMTADAEQADLVAYEANVGKILHELTNHGAVVYIALLDDQSKRPVVARPASPPAFPATTTADVALMSAHVKACNEIIRRVAAQYHATTVDFYSTTIFTDAATVYSDGNHPNDAGYDKIAQIWFAALGI